MEKRSTLIVRGTAALAGLLVSLIALGCKTKETQAQVAEIAFAEVAPVARGSVSRTLNLAGQFQPYQVVDVHAKVSGYVRHIYVDIGDKVRAGQTLAVLEVPELNAQLKGTASEVKRSKDEIARAKQMVTRASSELFALHSNYTRLQQASKTQPGLIAQQELDDAQAKDLSAQAQVDAAKSALAAAEQGSETAAADNERVGALAGYATVTAPLNGVIVWRYADTGALIQAGTASDTQSLPLVKLSQSDLLRLRLPVPEDAVRYIREGAAVTVKVDAVGRTLTGKIVRFTRDVNFDTRTMETEIDVENKNLSLTPGMYANTQLQLEHKDNALTIPVAALIRNGDESSVMVVDARDKVEARPVKTGIEGSTEVEVVSGLSEGEKVITGGQSKYHDGEAVKPMAAQNLMSADEQGGGK